MSEEERTGWFREARFGMFIHWGLYALLAGEWNGRRLAADQIGEWIMKFLRIPAEEYRKLAAGFNPVRFNADAWARLAKDAGMKYVVITAKHHDGFAMYYSRVSGYNIVDATPFGRDPMRELAEACRKEGLRFCFYYSHAEDWDHPDAIGNDWDYPADEANQFERYLREKSIPQMEELLTEYGPLGLIWFDRGIPTAEQGRRFADLVHRLQPGCLVNGRVGHYDQELLGDYQSLNDNGMPDGGIEELWETPQTLNDTWGFRKDDTNWKSAREVVRKLVEIVSKGGNYLLNVGPTAEGEIPAASVEILREVGQWVAANGESVYGTTASPFTDLPWGRCTVRGNRLYLHVFDWPADGRLGLTGLGNPVRRAWLLTDPQQSGLPVRRGEQQVWIDVPERAGDATGTVVVVEIEGEPEVEPAVVAQGDDGLVRLDYVTAKTAGKATKRFNRKGGYHIGKWTGPEDTVRWTFEIHRPGSFQVEIEYAALSAWQGRAFTVTIDETALEAEVAATGDWYEYGRFDLGTVDLLDPGRHTVAIRPSGDGASPLMYLRGLRLVPER
jgi:alpha-L-fucosidase